MTDQFKIETYEIYNTSNTLWEEKEMLWISSLSEHHRMMLSPLNSGYWEDEQGWTKTPTQIPPTNDVTSNIEGQFMTL
jgi:hypothetical protein